MRSNIEKRLRGFMTALAILLFAAPVIIARAAPGGAANQASREAAGIIVLDPGHGGADHGVRGPDGSLEKTIALSLARRIQARFSGGPRVVLTRTDDYRLDLYERTAMANHLKADLFISLHVGGAHLHRPTGSNIFYLKQMPEWDMIRQGGSPVSPEDREGGGAWDKIQERHIKESERLAMSIKRRLDKQTPFKETGVRSAPLIVLEGADMPAILVETGRLTNPGEEKMLRSEEVLSTLAEAIGAGIEDFFQDPARRNRK